MVQIAGCRNQDVSGRVHAAVIIQQHFASEFLDSFFRTENRLSQAVTFPKVTDESFMQHEFGLIGLHLDFFENDALFLLDVFLTEQRIQHQIGQNIERKRKVLIQHLRVETHQFLAGERIQPASYRIDRAGDVLGGTILSPLEHHVLDEMRNSVFRPLLYPRPTPNPHPERNRTDVRHRFRDDPYSVGEVRPFNFSNLRGCKDHMLRLSGCTTVH